MKKKKEEYKEPPSQTTLIWRLQTRGVGQDTEKNTGIPKKGTRSQQNKN